MGEWGCGSFENDDAGDWAYELESSGVAAVASALEQVSGVAEDEYLEAHEASAAIAVDEIVAAARDGDLSKLSETACEAYPCFINLLIWTGIWWLIWNNNGRATDPLHFGVQAAIPIIVFIFFDYDIRRGKQKRQCIGGIGARQILRSYRCIFHDHVYMVGL
jgi:Domain of unknown function (DUF4259)